jgi:hypothetical protein
VILGGWYTWTDAWNEASGTAAPGGCSGGTAGDPWTIDRAPADYARRHALAATGTAELGHGVTLGFIGRLLSGLPYTPWVDGDANGDGVANDRAFVFGGAAPAEVRAGMDRLLDEAPAGARECLRRQADRIAKRNSCRGPWMTTLDAQLAFAPGGAARRVRVSLTASNLPGVLDQVVHGSDELRGWGQPTTPDPVLLYVRGFDPAAHAFRYQVNPGFGKRTAGAGLPFTLTLQVRVRAGADPARQWMAEAVRASRRYGRRPSEIAAALATAIPNLPAQALAAAKTGECELTAAERDSLQRRADATQVEIDAVIALLAQAASAADTTARPDALEPVRQLTARARSIMAEDLSAIRQVIGPQKWERLPARFREPLGFAPLVPPRGIIIESPDP